MFSRLEADIAELERRIVHLRLASDVELARIQERGHAVLASPAALAAAAGIGAVMGMLANRRQPRRDGAPKGSLLLAATGILATLRQLAAVVRTVSAR